MPIHTHAHPYRWTKPPTAKSVDMANKLAEAFIKSTPENAAGTSMPSLAVDAEDVMTLFPGITMDAGEARWVLMEARSIVHATTHKVVTLGMFVDKGSPLNYKSFVTENPQRMAENIFWHFKDGQTHDHHSLHMFENALAHIKAALPKGGVRSGITGTTLKTVAKLMKQRKANNDDIAVELAKLVTLL